MPIASLFDSDLNPTVTLTATGEGSHQAKDWKGDARTFGQVSTPDKVAELMARWVVRDDTKRVLDPATGLGTLLNACAKRKQDIQCVGIDRDEKIFEEARRLTSPGAKLVVGDYLLIDCFGFDGIIANPPYVKAHRLDYSLRNWSKFEKDFGTRLDRLTNLYALFLLKIWRDLAPRGRAAVIVPAEFLNADFGHEIKVQLQRTIRPHGVAVFAHDVRVFANVATTTAILFLQKDRPPNGAIRGRKVSSVEEAGAFVTDLLNDANANDDVDFAAAEPTAKWLNQLLNKMDKLPANLRAACVRDFYKCSRGIATGANEYFCLSASQIADNGLHLSDFDRCVTRASDFRGLVFTENDFEELASSNRKCFLLNPRSDSEALKNYLALGEADKINDRHLPKHRPTWFRPESRGIATAWVPVFSRGPIKFILNESGAKNLTCFHGLYPREGFEHLAPLLLFFLNSSWGNSAFLEVQRFYGDGLNKVEPRDVESMPCPDLRAFTNDAQTLRAQFVAAARLPVTSRRDVIDAAVANLFQVG